MSLALALARLEANDRAGALEMLCDAWRQVRDPQLAATIETLAATVPSERPRGKTVAAKHAAWLKLVKKATPAQLGGLIATVTEIAKEEPLRERIWRLSERPHDPRFATALVAMLVEPPILGGTFQRPFVAAANALVELADVRQLAAFDQILEEAARGTTARSIVTSQLPAFRTKLAAEVAKYPIELAADDAAVLARIDATLAGTERAPHPDSVQLFAAIYAEPEDDAARLVLADELQGRGDPRGEFIALQLARGRGGTRSKRERELLAAAGRDWLGALDPVIAKTGIVFERGFLTACAIRDNAEDVFEALAGRPEWRTIEHLDLASARGRVPVADMPALRSLRNAHPNLLPEVAPYLERLELHRGDPDAFEVLTRRRLPALRHLAVAQWVLYGCSALAAFWASPLARQLETFAINAYQLDEWMPAAFELPFRVTLSSPHVPWEATIAGDTVSLARHWTPPDIATFDGLLHVIRRLPPAQVKRVELAVPTGEALPAEIARALQRFDATAVTA
jgi:uncharacterized protein (TIGR02996 family)